MQKFSRDFNTPLFKGKVSVHTGVFINNEWHEPADKQKIEFVVHFVRRVVPLCLIPQSHRSQYGRPDCFQYPNTS